MIESGNPEDQKIIEKVYELGQEHIFKFWEDLDEEQKKDLIDQIRSIDFELLDKLIKKHIFEEDNREEEYSLEPSPIKPIPSTPEQREEAEKAKKIGEKALQENKVGLFLVAGGQGSRLGYDGPKGCFKISPVKGKSIFQLHAEKILAMQKKYSAELPWYIMTSKQNDRQTREFFEKHDYFGLNKENIFFFKQSMIPAVTDKGKLILCEKGKIFKNPDGHGGSISAFKESGALTDAKKRGLEYLFYFQVDNILVNMADPVFIGYHIDEDAQMSSKSVEKKDPEEKVGIICYNNNKLGVVEYSVFPEELMRKKDEDGKLVFRAGNIAIHMINIEFIEKLNTEEFSLPYYKAHKAVSYVNNDGKIIEPEDPNAIKFEKFVFDALKETENSVTMEVKREEEFAPVKNKEGKDSVDTAKQLMIDFHKSMLRKAGIDIPENCKVEISPLFALNSEELKEKIDGDIELVENSEIYLGD